MKAKSLKQTFVNVRVSTMQVIILKSALIYFLGAHLVFGQQSGPDGIDGRGLSVQLKMPWTTLRAGERIQYEYILSNASERGTPVAIPKDSSEVPHFGWPAGGQPFLEPIWQPGNPVFIDVPLPEGRLTVNKAKWPPLDGYGNEMSAWLELPAGHRLSWNNNRLPDLYFGVASVSALVGLKAHWLTGSERWISSGITSLKVVNVPKSNWKMLFQTQWNPGNGNRTSVAYSIPIEDELFLFYNDKRLIEIYPDDQFEHKIDETGTNMEISITGPGGERTIFYHLRHGLTSDAPWPIGPVEMIYPKPEAIPPAELAAMRAEMGLNPDGSIPEGGLMPRRAENRTPGHPAPTAKDAGDDSSRTTTSGLLKVILAVLGVLALIILSLVLKKMKSTKPSTL